MLSSQVKFSADRQTDTGKTIQYAPYLSMRGIKKFAEDNLKFDKHGLKLSKQ